MSGFNLAQVLNSCLIPTCFKDPRRNTKILPLAVFIFESRVSPKILHRMYIGLEAKSRAKHFQSSCDLTLCCLLLSEHSNKWRRHNSWEWLTRLTVILKLKWDLKLCPAISSHFGITKAYPNSTEMYSWHIYTMLQEVAARSNLVCDGRLLTGKTSRQHLRSSHSDNIHIHCNDI